MKISQIRLKQIIKEEIQKALSEQAPVSEVPQDVPIPVDTSTPQGMWRDLKKQNLLSRYSRFKPESFVDLIENSLEPSVQTALATWGIFAATNLGLTLPKKYSDDKPELDTKKYKCFMSKMNREEAIRKLKKFGRILKRLNKERKAQIWLKANYENLVASIKEGMPRSETMQLPLYPTAEKHAKECEGSSAGL